MTALPAPATDERLAVKSELLGELEVSPDRIVHFPFGIPGFPEGRSYALLPTDREGVFWLQSADFSALSFLLIDPFRYFPGYQIDLSDDDVTRLGTNDAADTLVLAILTLGKEPGQTPTANLRAPILFNLAARTAHQNIRADEGFGVREEIDAASIVG